MRHGALQLLRAVDRRIEDPEATGAGREDRLEADRPIGVAELAGRRFDLARAGNAAELDGRHTDALKQRVGLRLVVRALHGPRGRDEHRYGETLASRRERLEVERRLWQHEVDALALDEIEDRVGIVGARAGRHDVECVAEVLADCVVAHVRADDADGALAVLVERADQARAARGAGGAEQDRDHLRSIRSPAR